MATTIDNMLGLKGMERFNYSHEDYYNMIIDRLGYEAVCACVPFEREIIAEKLRKDVHLNNTPMKKWDEAGGFRIIENRRLGTEDVYPINSQLRSLLYKNGVNCYSPAEGVCILKNCAKRMVMESETLCG